MTGKKEGIYFFDGVIEWHLFSSTALSMEPLGFCLAVLELDPEAQGVLCLEEPENGLHPNRIPAVLELLQDIATDVEERIGDDNPLRQVIINTHSPVVVQQVSDESLIVATSKEMMRGDKRFQSASFGCLKDTWRSAAPDGTTIVNLGTLLDYLNPVVKERDEHLQRRVIDRPDLQILLPGFEEEG
jgi:hypothetical protein